MSTFSNQEGWEFSLAASGNVTLPLNFNFTATDGSDYDVIIYEGVGTVTAASKTNLLFAVVCTGAIKGKVMPRTIGAITQVA